MLLYILSLRAAVPDAIRKCRNAGLRLVMVTGDHPTTAIAIARVVGIISEGNETLQELSKRTQVCTSPSRVNVVVVTGSELKRMEPSQLDALISTADTKKELIFARTTPEQKFQIVEAFQKLGQFVGTYISKPHNVICTII
jgi:sodium/potassium-transporting ATPase subunit alpha